MFYNQKKQMEVRSILRSNTLSSLSRKSLAKPVKPQKNKVDEDKSKENLPTQKSIFSQHPAFYLVRGTSPCLMDYKKFALYLYKGLFYSLNSLKGPTQQHINKKKVKLPEADKKKKFLMMDLDQTLIHSVFKVDLKGDIFKFNIRPHCLQFLSNMSRYYNVYVFTAGSQDYAEPIVGYLNQKKKTIQGLLHRSNCLQTNGGLFIKDLRIISNRELKDIVLVDNLVHSFGLQINNGIPILQFTSNKEDRELKALEKMLIELSTKTDVREYLSEKLNISSLLNFEEKQFVAVQQSDLDKNS